MSKHFTRKVLEGMGRFADGYQERKKKEEERQRELLRKRKRRHNDLSDEQIEAEERRIMALMEEGD